MLLEGVHSTLSAIGVHEESKAGFIRHYEEVKAYVPGEKVR